MKIKDNKVVFIDDQGNQTALEIYFTWKNEETNKNYVFFFDDTTGDLLAGVIEDDGTISDVETDEEYDLLDEVLENFENEQSSKLE